MICAERLDFFDGIMILYLLIGTEWYKEVGKNLKLNK